MQDKIKSLLKLAITAPSGDNCQPWRFIVKDSLVELHNDPHADTSYYNYQQMASLVSHGALLENIAIAAPTLGLKPDMQLFPSPDNQTHVANIVLEETLPSNTELGPFLELRTTNRKKYKGDLLSETQLATLQPDHADLSRVTTSLTNSRSDMDELADVICLSDRLVFENRQLHDFLFDHIRWSDDEAARCRDGLDIKTLELNTMDSLGFKLLKSWSFVSFAGRFGVVRAVAGNARTLAHSASAVGVILGQGGPDPQTYLEGGRLMQRIWLQATRMGLGFHPMTGISFLMQRVVENQADDMTQKHQRLIREAIQTISTISKRPNPTVLGLFRVGTVAMPSARSLRKELCDLMA